MSLSEMNRLDATEVANRHQFLKAQTQSLTNQIIQFTANLPSKWLRNRAKTPDQENEWQRLNLESTGLGKCLHARFVGRNDPLDKFLETNEMTYQEHSYANLLVDQYEYLWVMTQQAEKHVKKALGDKYLFKRFGNYSACAQYLEILKEEKDNLYRLCLENPYLHVSMADLRAMSSSIHKVLGSRQIRFSEQQQCWLYKFNPDSNSSDREVWQKVKSVSAQYPQPQRLIPWTVKSLQISMDSSKRDVALRARVSDFLEAMARSSEMQEKILNNRHGSRTRGKPVSYAWVNGQRNFYPSARKEPKYVTKT